MLRIIASKKLFRRAVDRNRARRRIRACLNQLAPGWRQGPDGTVHANKGALTLPLPALAQQIKIQLARRA